MIREERKLTPIDNVGIGSADNTLLIRVNAEDSSTVASLLKNTKIPHHVYRNGLEAISVEVSEIIMNGSPEHFSPEEDLARQDLIMSRRHEIGNAIKPTILHAIGNPLAQSSFNDAFFDYINGHLTKSECDTLKATGMLKDHEPNEKTAVLKLMRGEYVGDKDQGEKWTCPVDKSLSVTNLLQV